MNPEIPIIEPRSGLHYNKLHAPVRTYVDNLRAQVYEVFKKYNVTNMTEFIAKMKKIEVPDRQQVIKLMGAIEMAYKKNEEPGGMTVETAREILGEKNVLGPKEIENCFGFGPDEVPVIPFSRADLERAKELDQRLILRIDKTPDGRPLSLEVINSILTPRFAKDSKGTVLNTAEGWKGVFPEYFENQPPEPGWALVSNNLVPNTTSKNYLEQTEVLVDYLRQDVFKNEALPEPYAEAIQEFEEQKTTKNFASRISSDWKAVAQELSELKISSLLRPSAAAAMYDLLLTYDATGTRLLPDVYSWSNTRSQLGRLVNVGGFGAEGVHGLAWRPSNKSGGLGALVVRRV